MAKASGKAAGRKAVAKARKAGHKPFASKAQQRLFFANPKLRRYAKAKAHATGESHLLGAASKARYRALPNRKSVKRKVRGIKK